jgi:hypothetical protein
VYEKEKKTEEEKAVGRERTNSHTHIHTTSIHKNK